MRLLTNNPIISRFLIGIKIHTNQWKEGISWLDKTVAVIGTGATGVQAVPALAASGVRKLVVYQRTPAWIPPRFRYSYSDFTKVLFRYGPGLQRLYRWYVFKVQESRFFLFFMLPNKNIPIIGSLHSSFQEQAHKKMRMYIKKVVTDPVSTEYREKQEKIEVLRISLYIRWNTTPILPQYSPNSCYNLRKLPPS